MGKARYVPRALLIDSDPQIQSSFLFNPYWSPFPPRSLDLAHSLFNRKYTSFCRFGDYFEGIYERGSEMRSTVMEEIRKIQEQEDKSLGFLLFHSLYGILSSFPPFPLPHNTTLTFYP